MSLPNMSINENALLLVVLNPFQNMLLEKLVMAQMNDIFWIMLQYIS